MGIDIYAKWDGQGDDERQAQKEAWLSTEAGHIGYLREAYHGEPYATRHLVPEAFVKRDGALITAAMLRERLPETLRLAEQRERQVYGATTQEDIEPVLKSFREFVEHCEEVEKTTGKPVRIFASW